MQARLSCDSSYYMMQVSLVYSLHGQVFFAHIFIQSINAERDIKHDVIIKSLKLSLLFSLSLVCTLLATESFFMPRHKKAARFLCYTV